MSPPPISPSDPPLSCGVRLRFIDLARTVAIVMMLEGHFVDLVLAEEFRRPGWLPYDVWNYIRGLTAPLFFTVTGLVFAFLLCRHDGEPGFFGLKRVRRGAWRAVELFFWGYMLQLDARRIPETLAAGGGGWLFAFHVLQCIGAGLLAMITLYGLRRLTRLGPTWAWFALAGLAAYFGGIALATVPPDTGFPASAPAWLKNMFKGPHSVFPVLPWLGFTMYGATIGAFLRRHESHVKHPAFPWLFLGTGLVFRFAGWHADEAALRLVAWLGGREPLVAISWFHLRAGEAFIIIGLLMAWENRRGIRESWILNIGRNTFPIYVIHVIVLYGGVFGIGLKSWLRGALGPGAAALGALAFVAAFAGLAQAIPILKKGWIRLWPRLAEHQKSR
jgi:uncharacterized membrane protein